MPRLRILFSVPECFPFAKTGGLGDVAGALPIALARRGHDVRVVMPRYASTKRFPQERLRGPLGVPMGHGMSYGAVQRAELGAPGATVPVYLLENDHLFDRKGVYGDDGGSFGDNLERYTFLSRGTLELCRFLGFVPDVIHVHDWPTCLVPVYLNTVESESPLGNTASVLTIHNLAYQGWHGASEFWMTGLPRSALHGLGLERSGSLNLLQSGIAHATAVTTVSPTYAREIQTPASGEGLDPILRARGDVVGVLNGIDDVVWDPERDTHLAAPFSRDDLSGKAACKEALQRELGLEVAPQRPLIGLISRLVSQKGIDVVAEALRGILDLGAQVVILGSGEKWAEDAFGALSHSHPSFRAWLGMNEGLAHRIEAGADLFLMPSRYEPCGLNQMYSQRYGTLPIVRGVGGLEDTVENGVTGFKLYDLSAAALYETVRWALSIYRDDGPRFRAMQRAAMAKNMSWDQAGKQYEAVYRLAVARRRGRL